MRGRDRKADSGIQEDNQDAWQEELDKDTHQSIGEVVVVRLPFLQKKTVTLAILKGITDLKTEGNILPSLNLLDLQLSQNKDRRGDDGGENQDDEGHEEGLSKELIIMYSAYTVQAECQLSAGPDRPVQTSKTHYLNVNYFTFRSLFDPKIYLRNHLGDIKVFDLIFDLIEI